MSQEIILTTLPHQRITIDGNQFLKLSVFVSTRLTPAKETTLASFPDLLGWPEKLLNASYSFKLGNGNELEAQLLSEKIDPQLFGNIFYGQIKVKAFEQENMSNKLINSVPIQHINNFILKNYQKVAVESPSRFVSADKFIDPERFGSISRVKLNEQMINQTESAQLRQPIQLRNLTSKDESAERQYKTTLQRDKFLKFSAQMNPKEDFVQLRQFHRLNAEMKPMVPIPIKKPQFEFHDIVSVAGAYPQIMRKLGFVLDFLVPYQSNIPANGIINLVMDIEFSTENTVVSTPPTAYQITSGGFYVADRNNSIFKQGFVKINTPEFSVIQVDADGAGIKNTLMAEAKAQDIARYYRVRSEISVSRNLNLKAVAEPEPPVDEGLPFMRSAGIAIVKNGMSEHIFKRFDANLKLQPKLLDMALAGVKPTGLSASKTVSAATATRIVKTASPARKLNLPAAALMPIKLILPKETLYSDDVVQGYRMDVAYEEAPNRWYSLHQRQNEYTWYDAQNNPHPLENTESDEGSIELGFTENPEKKDDIFISETMARWEGWSLAVRRPGYAINDTEEDPAPSGQKRDLVNKSKITEMKKYAFDPTLEFKLNAQSKIVPGSLARLRFGKDYRFRIRTVDLAGNSVSLDLQPESAIDTIRTNIRYIRYEPLASPIVLVGNPLRDGEFLESMVIRSNFDRSAKDYENKYPTDTTFPDYSQRFMLPPKNSQQMAENHGMFENAMGNNPDAALTIYNLIINHEGLYDRPDKTAEKVYQPSEVEIIYLPDPMAAGVALFVADGFDHTHTQEFKPRMFGFFNNQELSPDNTNGAIPNDWYKARPLRIRLEEGELNTSWNSGERIFTVFMPKGFRTRIRYSTFWREQDFKRLSAIWKMMSDEKPANIGELEKLARSGQHWMLSPPREIELVHAVQQPVEAPEIKAIIPERDFGQTIVNIHTKFKVHGESTEKVEFQAKWTDPVDDGISVEIDYDKPGQNSINDIEIQYNDELLTRGTVPEQKLIPPHVQIRGPLKIQAIPVQRFQMRSKTDFEREPQPEAVRLNKVYLAQNNGYQKMMQQKASAPKTMVNRVKFDIEASRFRFVDKINLRQFPLVHLFGDTKHRWVDYQLVATTRYGEYFSKILKKYTELNTRRESPWWEKINILSSARPQLPEIDYIIPTFEWRKTQTADAYRHRRMGGGLRVYLKRPWFSTGADEMLAVVLPPKPASAVLTMVAAQPGYTDYYSHWAMDPVLYSVPPENVSPQPDDFRMNPVPDENLQYPGIDNGRANIAAYPVHFDQKRQQWFCDMAIDPKAMYFPFVKLALARYQPYSVKKEKEDVCLSGVVMSTFIQLVPERQTTLRFTKDDANSRFTVTVEGTIYNERMARYGNNSLLRISFVDSRRAQPIYGVIDDGGTLKNLADEGVEITISQKHVSNNRFTVSRDFRLPRDYKTAPFQVVIEEFERGPVKTQGDRIDNFYKERLEQSEETDRLIYADVFKINETK